MVPTTLPTRQQLIELLPYLTSQEREELKQIVLALRLPIWIPLPGPQTQVVNSKATQIGYGGAAGGGKTDLTAGIALTQHQRSLILRHEGTQLKALEDRFKEIIADYPPAAKMARYNGQDHIWRGLPDRRVIQMAGIPNLGDEKKFQGQNHDLKAFDEATEIAELQYRFVIGWLRSARLNQITRVLLTFNPPTTVEGRWVIQYFAPWLDQKHKNPARSGEIRYFTTIGKEEVEFETGDPFMHKGKLITPISRTFIFAKLADNPYYATDGKYEATLQALPEPLRSQMLNGDFLAGIEDDSFQVIPTEWVLAAMERGKARPEPNVRLSTIGVDVARGGKDKTVIAQRFGNWFAPLKKYPGSSTPDGPAAAAYVWSILPALLDIAPEVRPKINVDVIGVGAAVYDALKGKGLTVTGVNVAEGSSANDKSGRLGFVNLRAEIMWKFREALDPHSGEDIALPDDRELLADLTASRWELKSNGIQIEGKPELKKRIGRSPDCADAVLLAFHNASSLTFYTLEDLEAAGY